MLSSTLHLIDGVPVGQCYLVRQLLKGAYNRNAPRPRYTRTWDVNLAVNYILSLGPSEDLDLTTLTKKLAVLLALATLLRISELASISRPSIAFSATGTSSSLLKPRKAQHSGPLRVVRIDRLANRTLCPVYCLGIYTHITDPLRTASNGSVLFIEPFGAISPSTVGRWVKSILRNSGVDPAIFSAHSTRGAAASSAAQQGIPVDSILRVADWASENTFNRFYRRDVHPSSLATTVLAHFSES